MGNPQKDNFHNLILGIDKIVTFGILDSNNPNKTFSFQKGVGHGERPLKFLFQSFNFLS